MWELDETPRYNVGAAIIRSTDERGSHLSARRPGAGHGAAMAARDGVDARGTRIRAGPADSPTDARARAVHLRPSRSVQRDARGRHGRLSRVDAALPRRGRSALVRRLRG